MAKIKIEPSKRIFDIGINELLEFRGLIYFFVWRSVKLRYKQTIIGILWVVIQPLITMLIFTLFFGRFAKIPSNGVPYSIFVYIGLILWGYFSFSVSHASESMIENETIIKKVYFPRLIIPISSAFVGLIDLFIASIILIGLMFYYNYIPNLFCLIYLPVFLFIMLSSSIGIGAFLASLNVKYRDIRYVLPFFIQILMFLTPVIYPSSIVSAKYKFLFYLNPMTGVIENARDVILGLNSVNLQSLLFSFLAAIFIFIFGLFYFRKTESFFADII